MLFDRFDSTQNKVLQAEANDYMSAINSICENKQSTYGNMFSSLKLGVTPHLCGLASNQVRSLFGCIIISYIETYYSLMFFF